MVKRLLLLMSVVLGVAMAAPDGCQAEDHRVSMIIDLLQKMDRRFDDMDRRIKALEGRGGSYQPANPDQPPRRKPVSYWPVQPPSRDWEVPRDEWVPAEPTWPVDGVSLGTIGGTLQVPRSGYGSPRVIVIRSCQRQSSRGKW